MAKKITPAASASAIVRGFADNIAPSMRALNTAANAHEKTAGSFEVRMTEAFVAVLAADHGLTARDASKLVAEKCAYAKQAGTPSTLRTWNRTFFSDAATLNALRRSIIVEGMTPADYQKAVVEYAKGLNPRKAYEDAAKARKAADKASADALKAEQARQAARDTDANAEGVETAPVSDTPPTALDLQAHIAKCLETLSAMEGGAASLATLQGQITALLTPADTAPVAQAA